MHGNTVLHCAYGLGDVSYIDVVLGALKKEDHPHTHARNADNVLPCMMVFNRQKYITIPHYPTDPYAKKKNNGLYLSWPSIDADDYLLRVTRKGSAY